MGIVSLSGILEQEGIIGYKTLQSLQRNLPGIELFYWTIVMEEFCMTKSEDEICCREKSAEIADLAIDILLTKARPCAILNKIYAEMVYAMVKNGA